MGDYYLDPKEATRIRVHHDGNGEWGIDGAGDDGRWTAAWWDRDGSVDRPMTRERAIERAAEFASAEGLPAGLPVEVWDADQLVERIDGDSRRITR